MSISKSDVCQLYILKIIQNSAFSQHLSATTLVIVTRYLGLDYVLH